MTSLIRTISPEHNLNEGQEKVLNTNLEVMQKWFEESGSNPSESQKRLCQTMLLISIHLGNVELADWTLNHGADAGSLIYNSNVILARNLGFDIPFLFQNSGLESPRSVTNLNP
jgi:hypothetical protein